MISHSFLILFLHFSSFYLYLWFLTSFILLITYGFSPVLFVLLPIVLRHTGSLFFCLFWADLLCFHIGLEASLEIPPGIICWTARLSDLLCIVPPGVLFIGEHLPGLVPEYQSQETKKQDKFSSTNPIFQ